LWAFPLSRSWQVSMLKFSILAAIMLWVYVFFGNYSLPGIHRKNVVINILTAIIIVLIVVGFLS
jgi:hypothetical protein